jgi:hypothetical protein
MRPDDAFWAARIVAKFSDAAIRSVVEKARYTEPAASDYMTQTLIARRDKVVATWINQVCPVTDPALSADGTLTFANAAVDAGAAPPAERYTLQWFRFDNAADTHTRLGDSVTTTSLSARAPAELTGAFVGVTISATHSQRPGWARPSTFFFRRTGSAPSWTLVGVERG